MRVSAITRLVTLAFHKGDGARYAHTFQCFIVGSRGTLFSLEGKAFYEFDLVHIRELLLQQGVKVIDGLVSPQHYLLMSSRFAAVGVAAKEGRPDSIDGTPMVWFEAVL